MLHNFKHLKPEHYWLVALCFLFICLLGLLLLFWMG